MTLLKTLTPVLLLGTALSVAVGAVYVSVQAATQEAEAAPAQTDPAADPPAAQGDEAVTPVPVPDEKAEESTIIDDELLAPEDVHHSREHHLTLGPNGTLLGKISTLTTSGGDLLPVTNLTVRIVRNGDIVGKTVTAGDGSFAFAGLSPGVVSLIATNDTAMCLFGVRLIQADDVKPDENALNVMHAIAVTGADLPVAKEVIYSNLPLGDTRFGETATESEEKYLHGEGQTSTTLSHHQVQLRADGSLQGVVNILDSRTGRHREVVDLTLHFIANGQYVGSTRVDPNGDFSIAGLSAGVYSIVSTGSDGILAVGIDVVDSVANLDANSKYKLVSIAQTLDLALSPTSPKDLNTENQEDNTDGALAPGANVGSPVAGAPSAPGGGVPGGAGGGSAGGGGGLGALLGAGAGAAVGAALANDNGPASDFR